MKLLKMLITSGAIATLSFNSLALSGQSNDKHNELRATLSSKLGMQVSDIKPAAIEGLFEIMTARGLFYSSSDGRYLIRGHIFDTDNKFANLTEQSMAKMRSRKLESFTESMISYKAKDEKHTITVFTDVDCGYCRKLHSEMQQYNDLGITVNYLAFPRGGERSPAWTAMQSLWCSADQHKATDELKAGVKITSATCPNRVPDHYQLGIEFGVTGTPAIILEDGTMIPGYQDAARLLEVLKQKS